MSVGEPEAGCGELVAVGCQDFLRAVATQVAIADVIGIEEDDVGFLRGECRVGSERSEGG